jgi:outer membrane biosynthesis protein TonB
MYFFQSLFFKTAFSFILIFCIFLLPVFAKDNKTKYEEAKQKLEPEIRFLTEQYKKIIQQSKDELNAIPVEPDARKGEPKEVRKRREDRAKLANLIIKLENSVIDIEKDFKSFPWFIASTDVDSAIASYVTRIEAQIEKHGTKYPFKINGLSSYGNVNLFFIIREDGKLDRIEAKSASIEGLGEHAVKLMQQLAPFEPFPPEVAIQGNRMTFSKDFNFTKE